MIVFIARTMGSIGRRSGSSFVAVAALVADESEEDDEEVAASADDDGRGTSSSCRRLGEDIAMSPVNSLCPANSWCDHQKKRSEMAASLLLT
jgi:hypothetical protein